MHTPTIGLFGTCGGSKWRDAFIAEYENKGIQYFNPQVDDWKPELAQIEASHLANDEIILFPVTDETYGTGSLAESGFSILQALKNLNREFIIFIAPGLQEHLVKENPVCAKESLRARKLVNAHLAEIKLDNVHVCSNLDEMLAKSLELVNVDISR